MKKITIILAAAMIILSFAACSFGGKDTGSDDMLDQTEVSDMADIYTMGLGVAITSDGSSATEDSAGRGEVQSYIASVTFDGDNRVDRIHLDCLEAESVFDQQGVYSVDESAAYTKKERGDDYGMKGASSIGKEWYEQVEALEAWMIGKSVDEIVSMKTYEKDETHTAVPDDPEISSSCTISVEGFFEALTKAQENAR